MNEPSRDPLEWRIPENTSAGESGATSRETAEAAAFPPDFRKEEEIGKGGMGVVWRARDLALKRDVAVKLLLDKYDAQSYTAARFVREAHITSQLQHPGIPAVYRVGQLGNQKPYLAMKLVRGQTLAQLLQKHGPGGSRWLSVFESICQAVGYAHSTQTIHRDLKPANVMVGAFGEVQVMDWGLAKKLDAVKPAVDEDEMYPRTDPQRSVPSDTGNYTPEVSRDSTIIGTVLGTPSYMPPEQARGEPTSADPRADVFSLGAILCELLTGHPPVTGTTVKEVLAKVSVGKFDDAMARLDACKNESPDLIALAKRCLSARAVDRPKDASAVAEEVAKLRADAEARALQAEVARAAAAVQLAEQRKRRRVLLGLIAVLAAGIVGTLVSRQQAVDARNSERIARGEEQEATRTAIKAREEEQAATAKKLEYLNQVEKSSAILAGIFEKLNQHRLRNDGRNVVTALADEVSQAADEIGTVWAGDPQHVAGLRTKLGMALMSLGYPDRAVKVFKAVYDSRNEYLGPDHAETLAAASNLASSYEENDQKSLSLPLYAETHARMVALQGMDHPDTLTVLANLALCHLELGDTAAAMPLLKDAYERRKRVLGPVSAETLMSLNNLALGHEALGQYPLAVEMLEFSLKNFPKTLPADHPHRMQFLSNLASSCRRAGQLNRVIPLNEESLQLMTATLLPDHPSVLTCASQLATAYIAAGLHERGITLHEEVYAKAKIRFPAMHPDFIVIMSSLGSAYLDLGMANRSIPLLEEAAQRQAITMTANHPSINIVKNNLAVALMDVRRFDRAYPLLIEVLNDRKKKLKPGHPEILKSMDNLGDYFKRNGRFDKSLPLAIDSLALKKQVHQPGHPEILKSMNNLAVIHQMLDDYQLALPLFRDAIAQMNTTFGRDDYETLNTMANYGSCLRDAGHAHTALPVLETVLRHSTKHRSLQWAAKPMIECLSRTGQRKSAVGLAMSYSKVDAEFSGAFLSRIAAWNEAAGVYRTALDNVKKNDPDGLTVLIITSHLGEALAGQKKYDEAEQLLLAGCDGLQKRATTPTVSNRLREAIQRLINFYIMTNQPAKAAEWRLKLPREFAPAPQRITSSASAPAGPP